MHFVGLFNQDGGTFRDIEHAAFEATAKRILAEYGHTLSSRWLAGSDIVDELETAAASKPEVLLVGGGDGTVSAAAGIAFRTGVTLAVLPAGTMNLFARSLQLPLGLEDALRAIASGDRRQVDIATASGRAFVNQFAVGLHPRLVRIRETLEYRGRVGKIIATIRAFVAAIVQPPRFLVEIRGAGEPSLRVCSALEVVNGPLRDDDPATVDVEQGTLGLYAAGPLTFGGALQLAADLLFRRWRENPAVFNAQVQRLELVFPRLKRSAQATLDGELIPLERRVELISHPGALNVLAPSTPATRS